MDLSRLKTEQLNNNSANIDTLSALEIVKVINQEDESVAGAVRNELERIAKLSDIGYDCIKKGGRIFYVGTGTSGRLGVLDASEIPPTFNTPPELFQGIIAGGYEALHSSRPGIEDDESAGSTVMENYQLTDSDLVIGLTASGRTPFVRAALAFSKKMQAKTALICCNKNAEISPLVDVAIEVNTGPEVLAGSTRLKAGTAQKLVLNMFSTCTMIRLGKVYKNLMVDLRVSNKKLYDRAIRIIVEATGASKEEAIEVYEQTNHVKTSIVSILTGAPISYIQKELDLAGGRIRDVLKALGKNSI